MENDEIKNSAHSLKLHGETAELRLRRRLR